MQVLVKSFEELTSHELYEVLRLRSEVFVVEQECVYQDIDGKDEQALHVLGSEKGILVGYARVFPPNVYFEEAAIGRVVVKNESRKRKLGHVLITASITAIQKRFNTGQIRISAQAHLTAFYEVHGFQQSGKQYLEDGIPHVAMIRS